MGTELIQALQVALKQVALQVASLGLNSIIDGNGTHWIASSIASANADAKAIAGYEWVLRLQKALASHSEYLLSNAKYFCFLSRSYVVYLETSECLPFQ